MSKTITIGVLSPVTGGFYYGNILAGITREASAVGGRVVLVQTLDAGLSSDDVMDAPDFTMPIGWDHLDGVISVATATQRNYLDGLRASGKVVVLASHEIPGLDVASAAPDNVTGVTSAVDHLIGHGHTRIGFAANLVQSDMRARHDAYRLALMAHGIDPDPTLMFVAFDNGEQGGRDVARQLVAAGMPLTALVVATDRNALGCIAQLTDLGVVVPDELAIVGFDGLDAGAHTQPTLSTVSPRFEEIGASAARLLLAQLRGEEVAVGTHVSPSEFVPRGSCGCPGDGGQSATLDGGVGFWRNEARIHVSRSTRREQMMRQQYEIGTQLFDHERTDPRRLEWLAATDVRGAYLAVWDGDPSAGRVRIVGAYDPHSVLADVVGTVCTIEQFPPASLIEMSDPLADEVAIVVPVKARGLDFGLLALVAEVDETSATGREVHNQWADLLTAALEQRALLESVRMSEERYSLWAVATTDGLWDWDLTTDVVYYSRRCMELLGQASLGASAPPTVWFDAVHPDDLERVRDMLRAATATLEPFGIEYRLRGADRSYRHMSCRGLPVGPVGGPATRIVGSMHDIEPRKQLEEQLRQGALYDEVTGLPNRKLFLERLGLTIAQARRSPELRYAVVFLDLDGFKLVNDSLGHQVGDRFLAKIGERLRGGLRETDLAARFGGDEFAVLLHAIEPSAVAPIVERMQQTLSEPIELDGHEVAVTASVGIAMSGRWHSNAEDVLRDADIAMYRAKAQRRGSSAVFDVDMHAGAVTRLGMQSELRKAMERDQFEVHYQPIVDLDSEGTDHFEALVRWRHAERGLVLPMDFLPAMEESGLMVRLERWIIDEVCRQISEWQRTYDGSVNVSVNVSHRLFWDSGLLSHIADSLRRHALEPANLTFEVTAGAIVREPERARVIIDELHAAGIRVQIDNFGTGMSTLHALHRSPVHGLKIDRSFINELDVDPRTTELVRIIITMAKALGIHVVAEGVETEAQLERLSEMGCRNVQGFWFTHALDGAAAAQLLGQVLPVRDRIDVVLGVGVAD